MDANDFENAFKSYDSRYDAHTDKFDGSVTRGGGGSSRPSCYGQKTVRRVVENLSRHQSMPKKKKKVKKKS